MKNLQNILMPVENASAVSPSSVSGLSRNISFHGVWKEVHNVTRRNAGDLSTLSRRYQRRRLNLAHRAVVGLLGSQNGQVSQFISLYHISHIITLMSCSVASLLHSP